MRRSFRSTTALAAVIAMLAPASVLAETSLPPQKAAAMDKASREDMPQRAAKLDAELADGLSAGMLTCVGDAPRPCPDDQPLVTPGGLAVRLAQDDAIVLAPRKTQREASQPEQKGEGAAGKAAAEAGGEAAAAAKAAASGEASGKKNRNAGERGTGEEAKAGKKKEKVERKAAGDADPGDPALAAGLAAAQKAAKVNEDAAAAASDNGSSEAKAAQAEPANASGPVVSEPIPPAKPQVESSVAEANPVVEDRPTPKAKQGKEGKKKRDMASEAEAAVEKPVVSQEEPDADALARALGKASGKDTPPGGKPDAAVDKPVVAGSSDGTGDEADAAALAAALAAATGKAESAAADANAAAAKSAGAVQQAEAPKPVTVDEETSRSLEETLKAAAAAAETKGAAKVKKAQQAQQVASKPDPASDNAGAAADAAASAAAAGTAPVADALNAPAELSNDATAVVVTEGSARSSAEDFATRITDGLTREQQAQFEQLRKQVAAQRDSGKPVVVNDTASASDDDDDKERDLARLLLAGVGGYALANILANNGQIALSTPDRVVVQQPDGSQSIIKDDNALLLRPGTQVTNENFADGSSRSIVTRDDGSRVVTIRDANLQVLRRTLIASDGTVTELIDDAQQARPVVVSELPPAAPPVDLSASASEDALRAALAQEVAVNRSFTLGQIRNIPEVRALVAPIDINAITFDTGSAAISPDQAQQLATLGRVISESVRSNPAEVFLIEGYTDTVGSAAMNLALSDRRAESVALALSQYFDVPPENLVVQGYGERFLKVNAEGDIRENRRASVRRITDLLATN